jgi:hypothetical protein
MEQDKGFLFYELSSEKYGSSPGSTIDTDKKYKYALRSFEVFGKAIIDFNPTPYSNLEGNDSLDKNGNTVYPPDEFLWYQDKDIIGYKIKETTTTNSSGKLKSKKIDAIAPLVNTYDMNGEIQGTRELFWVDYKELSAILKDYYVTYKLATSSKVITFFEYFEARNFNAVVIENE